MISMNIGEEDVINGVVTRCVLLSEAAMAHTAAASSCEHCALQPVKIGKATCEQPCRGDVKQVSRPWSEFRRIALVPVSEIPRYALEGWLE